MICNSYWYVVASLPEFTCNHAYSFLFLIAETPWLCNRPLSISKTHPLTVCAFLRYTRTNERFSWKETWNRKRSLIVKICKSLRAHSRLYCDWTAINSRNVGKGKKKMMLMQSHKKRVLLRRDEMVVVRLSGVIRAFLSSYEQGLHKVNTTLVSPPVRKYIRFFCW